MRYSIQRLILLILIPLSPLLAQEPEIMHLNDLIAEGLRNNPDLKSTEDQWQAALARVPQAGALPDPTVSFNLLNVPVSTFAFDQEPMTGKQVALMQMFPFPGKQGTMENIAREAAAVKEGQHEELRNQLVKNIRITYYNIFLINKSIETVEKNTAALGEFVKIAETKYSVGKGLQQDVLRAQVELSRMLDKRIQLDKKRDALRARLNQLLNRPAASPLGPVDELQLIPYDKSLAELQQMATSMRPLLKTWQSTIRQSDEQLHLARKGYLPDFGLTLAYSQRDLLKNGAGGADFFTAMLNVKVPFYFWRKQRKQVEETQVMKSATEQKYRQVLNSVFEEIDRNLSEVQNDARLAELFKTGIIPQAAQSLQSAIAGYQTDKVDFLTLITNQINLFNFELDYYRIVCEYNIALAELEAAVGTNWDANNR